MNKDELVCIITINYNHSKETIECVNSILKSNYTNFFLILIDNGSEKNDYNNLCSSITDDRIKIIRQKKNNGYVGGVNRGLEEAKKYSPRYYLIMNNDTIIDNKAINELVNTVHKYGDHAIVTGKVYNMDEPDTLQYVGQWCRNPKKLYYPPYVKNMREKDIGQYEDEMELGMTDDIFWLLPRKIFETVGYYSTDFFLYGEQNDYVLRALKKNFKLIYTPKSKIWHYHHLTTSGGDSKSLQVAYWKSYAMLLLRYKYLHKYMFIRLYMDFVIRVMLKIPIYYLFNTNTEKLEKAKVDFLALKYFTKWLLGEKKPNTGFNPVNTKFKGSSNNCVNSVAK